MTSQGRPLRFLGLVLSGWVGARAVMLWPADPFTTTAHASVPSSTGMTVANPVPRMHAGNAQSIAVIAWPRHEPVSARLALPIYAARSAIFDVRLPTPTTGEPPLGAVARDPGIIAGLPAALSPGRSRWFGSAWALARGGSGPPGGVPGVQLGGSQAGIRIGYALTDDYRVAIVARASTPLGSGMREAAIGVEWQPTRLPVRLVAEQRFALNRGKGGRTLAVIGGVNPVDVAAGFRLEAYGQAGVIGRDGGEAFADGAVRLARPVATLGRVRLDAGGGSWGAAQKGASRLDVGPSLSATLPIGKQPVRLSLDWRQRAAGNAAPGSGLVLTMGADF